MPEGRRFVITGLSRISVRVVRRLHRLGAAVTVVVDAGADDRLLGAIGDRAEVVVGTADRAAALRSAGLASADGLLALDDDDLENLRSVGCATDVAPDVPVVVRSFDAALADRIELGSNVRRAYSVSALAAPAFVAAALGDELVETLRLGRDEVTLVRLTSHGLPAPEGVTVVARHGDEVLVAGRRREVLAFALANDPLPSPPAGATVVDDPEDDVVGGARRTVTSTLLPASAVLLAALVVGGTIAFGVARDLGPLDALYFTVGVAWGNGGFDDAPGWQKAFGLVLMVGAGALVGVLFSHLAAVATAERLDVRMEKRASGLSGHVVVAGLGTIGYRVLRLLDDLDVDVAAIEQSTTSRFATAGAAHGPVLAGDARLPEDLARTAIARAACLIAVTDDDLVNVSACLQAKAANPGIRTVARIFDETVADHAGPALGIDAVVSASRVAAGAFVGAALDGRAPRRLRFHDRELVAFRHEFDGEVPAGVADGHIVAVDGTSAIVCGDPASPSIAALLGR